jgi:two-component sensor histidine kinase
MDDREVPTTIEAFDRFRRYHRLVLDFSKGALGTLSFQDLLQRACECATEGTSVQRAKVLQYRPTQDDLVVLAGVGWNPGVVGRVTLPSDMRSPPGRAFRTAKPTFIDDLPDNPDFDYSELLCSHGIVSLVNVPIAVDETVWGVLEIDSAQPRHFDDDDKEFLSGLAEISGRTIENRERLGQAKQAGLEHKIELQEREALFRELQHRIGNQLQLIIGALEIAQSRVSDGGVRDAIESVIKRVVSIADSHQQLSLARIERSICLAAFLTRLIPTLGVPDRIKVLTFLDDATAAIGTAVRVGLILNELVTNCVKHAFRENGGNITISLRIEAEGGRAVLRVIDDGRGIGEPRATGSGIGLIRTLAEQIGGSAEWSVAEPHGTNFTLRFPLER